MPASFMKKTMAYLGLVDDDYDDYDDYERRIAGGAAVGRTGQRPVGADRRRRGADHVDAQSPDPHADPGRDEWYGGATAPPPVSSRSRGGIVIGAADLPGDRRRPGCTSWPPVGSPTPRRSPTG